MKQNLLSSWENIPNATYEEITRAVLNVFANWERQFLEITHGKREKTVSDTYGFPYTSSSGTAILGVTNVQAEYFADRNYCLQWIALSEDMKVVGYFEDYNGNGRYIDIGCCYTLLKK